MSKNFTFSITNKVGLARTGIISTPHGEIKTPEFIPVGTAATVKALTPEQIKDIGAQAVLSNTYHLHLRPGEDLIKELGGLHEFMGWQGPTFTDSGGFQAFSLGLGMEHQVSKIGNIFPEETSKKDVEPKKKLAKVDDEGVTFKSPVDGSMDRFTPENSIRMQEDIGADIILAFDECTSPLSTYEYTKLALGRTHKWAKRSLAAHSRKNQALYGIIQGGAYMDLRKESSRFISSLPFDGIAIGGSLGKSKKEMYQILDWCMPLLPDALPRHLLGIGSIEDLFGCVEKGIDTFDCVMPTRLARAGYLLRTPEIGGAKENKFRWNIKNARFTRDPAPFNEHCDCYTCKTFSRAYLRHLFRTKELLFNTLASIHNLRTILRLMEDMRKALFEGSYPQLREKWIGP